MSQSPTKRFKSQTRGEDSQHNHFLEKAKTYE